jgi:ATP-dependent DNA helicase RecG
MLKAGIFATDEKLTFLDMKLFEDNIFNLIRIAEEYILKNIRRGSDITEMERKEISEIPVAVIREVLANSFAHSVYKSRTAYEICIHPGMITIYSPGDYASVHKPEEYIKGNYESEIRNSLIAKMLFLNKSIEQFGSGFKRIDSLCKDAGSELLGDKSPSFLFQPLPLA